MPEAIPQDIQEHLTQHWDTVPEDIKAHVQTLGFSPGITAGAPPMPGVAGQLPSRASFGGPPGPPGMTEELLRASPAITGATIGAMNLAPMGAPAGPLGMLAAGALGAGLGAMPPEAALWAGQRALGLPQGQEDVIARTARAGAQGLRGGLIGGMAGPVIQKGLEWAGDVGGRLASRLAGPGRYGIEAGAGEEAAAGMAGTRGAAGVVRKAAERQGSQIAQAGQQIMRDMRIEAPQELATTRAVRDLRTALRDVMTTGTRRGAEAYPGAGPLLEGIPTRLGKVGQGVGPGGRQTTEAIERYIENTVTEARVAEEIAKNPAAWDELLARTGTPASQGIGGQSWWTKTLVGATGKKGLQKGILDAGKVVAEFDKLEPGQASRMFGDKLPAVSRFIDTLRGLPLGGAVPEKVTQKIDWKTVLGGGALGRYVGGGPLGAAVGGGATVGARLIGPFLAAKMLTSADGAAMLTQMLTSSFVSGAAEIAPTAASIGAQTYTQTQPAP